jgi:hypothetical protein
MWTSELVVSIFTVILSLDSKCLWKLILTLFGFLIRLSVLI